MEKNRWDVLPTLTRPQQTPFSFHPTRTRQFCPTVLTQHYGMPGGGALFHGPSSLESIVVRGHKGHFANHRRLLLPPNLHQQLCPRPTVL